MDIFRGIQSLNRSLTHPVVTIGNFDGVHLGHQKIIATALEKARARKGTCVAFTFRPHPQIALRPGSQVALLSTYDEKLDLLRGLGVDAVIEEPFSREFSTTAPERFFTDALLRRLSAEAIVVGYDFAFGKEREGQLEVLSGLCEGAGVELAVVPPQKVGGEVASSSRVRQHLLAGEIPQANALLGREFFYRGAVIRGEGRGRKLGFPTANLKLENKLALPYGVYATWAVTGGKTYPGVTNVGVRPTFAQAAAPGSPGLNDPELPALVEAHLLLEHVLGPGATIDLYGQTLEVRFVRRLREERKFDGVEALKRQISVDAAQAAEVLRER